MTVPGIDNRIAAAREAIKAGRLETALETARAVLSDEPNAIDAIEIVALVNLQRGESQFAEEALRSAIGVAPDRRWPYADLTRLLLKLGRTDDAEQVARSALIADARNPDARAMLGSILAEREEWHGAARHFEQAIALAGKHPELLAALGRAQMRLGRLDEAQRTLDVAARADPSALDPAVFLADVLERLGRFAEATEQLDRAEAIARRQGTDVDLQRSVLLSRIGEHEKALALLDGRSDLSGAARLQRGRLYERAGRYAEAWEDWTDGKAQLAERSGRHYRTEEVRAEAARLAEFVNSATPHVPAPLRSDVPQPIFIIGFPRSGTTLTEQILASHSAIRAGGELPFGPELATAMFDAEPLQLRDHYLAKAAEVGLLADGAEFFTDKMPDNSFWLPLLRLAFPQSPAIRMRRHPLDVLTSVMAHDMTHGFSCGYRLEDAATHLALVDELLERYRAAGFGPTHEIGYEAVVANQVAETDRLTKAVGLKVEPAQLSFHERSEVSPTPSYAQVRERLNDRSIGRWRNFAEQLRPIQPIVAEAMERGGYTG
jgi:tetratricopeptide (TPR) repeat protein